MTDIMCIDYRSPEVVKTLKSTVAVGATDAEFAMFTSYCQSTGLNPFKKEVWFIKTKGYQRRDGTMVDGKVQIMTGINGFLAIANRHPQYDGLECEVTQNDKGQVVSATVKVWRKDRRFPSVATALWSEYYKPSPSGKAGVWEQMPSIMLSKCAKALALREAFPQELNGLYTADEMPHEYSQPSVSVSVSTVPVSSVDTGPACNKETGEVTSTSDDDDVLPWEATKKASAASESKAVTTKYDLSGLDGSKLDKATEYLKENMCKQVAADVWECPIRLEKLTSCIVE